MTEDLHRKKPAPVFAQLLFMLGWLLLIVLMSRATHSSESDMARINELMTPALMRLLIVIQGIIVFILPVIFFIFILRRSSISFLQFNTTIHPFMIGGGLLAILLSYPLVEWIGNVNAAIQLPDSFSGLETWMKTKEKESAATAEILLNDKSTAGLIGNLLTIAFTAAFCEELFFRAMLQNTLIKTKLNNHAAIWIAALIFSAIHLQFYGFFPRLVLGAILGYLFYFTQNIWISILAHFFNNALVVIAGFISEDVKLNPLDNQNESTLFNGNTAIAFLSLILVFGVLYLLRRQYQQLPEENTE